MGSLPPIRKIKVKNKTSKQNIIEIVLFLFLIKRAPPRKENIKIIKYPPESFF